MNASDTLNKITKHRRSQEDFARFLIEKDNLLGWKVKDCGSWLHIREWLNHGTSALINANFCKKHILCPVCSMRRAIKLVARYTPKAEDVAKLYPILIPVMITVTVKSGPDLIERTEHLCESWKRMTAAARKAKAGKTGHQSNAPVEWNKVIGSLRAFEVKNGDHGWHPHAHVFALISDYIDREALSAEWLRFTGDSCIVDVRKVKGGMISGMCEVIKYTLKHGDLTNEDRLTAHRALSGKRLVDPQGLLRGVLEGDIDHDDLPDWDGPTRDLICSWMIGAKRYHIQEVKDEFAMTKKEIAVLSCSHFRPA